MDRMYVGEHFVNVIRYGNAHSNDLGHASISTTSRYVSTNLQMKRDALEHFWERSGLSPARARPWSPTPDLLAYLASI